MRKLFITDDSQLYIDTLSAILSEEDIVIASTTKPVEALERIVAFMPDVIIVDKVMPDKDGMELLADIKNDDRVNYIPRLLISSEELKGIVGSCSDLDDYISKQEDVKDIKSRIKTYSHIGVARKAARGKV